MSYPVTRSSILGPLCFLTLCTGSSLPCSLGCHVSQDRGRLTQGMVSVRLLFVDVVVYGWTSVVSLHWMQISKGLGVYLITFVV